MHPANPRRFPFLPARRWSCLAIALACLSACEEQHNLDRTSSRFITVNGKRMKVDLSPTGQPQEFDLLVVRDAIVVNPDPDSEVARGREAAARVMREVCNLRRLTPQVIDDRLEQQVNYYVRFRCT